MVFTLVSSTALVIFVAAFVAYMRRRLHPISILRGHGHWILGFLPMRSNTAHAGKLELELLRTYGGAAKLKGAFGRRLLWVCDPKAAQYILQGADYGFERADEKKEFVRFSIGSSILIAKGDVHKRHRRIMQPGFGAVAVTTYIPIFAQTARRMSELWVEALQDKEEAKLDMMFWTVRATLDALGEAAFDYEFDALSDSPNEITRLFGNFVVKSGLRPSDWEIFLGQAVTLLPNQIIQLWNAFMPNKRRTILRDVRWTCERIASQLIAEKSAAVIADRTGTDVMSLLVKANLSADAESRLNDEEMLGQLSTLILAGHETTASAIAWALYELARDPAMQNRLREEIRTMRRERNEPELTAATLDSMPYLNAVIKETLRMRPTVNNLQKQATQDGLIPLLTPVIGEGGVLVREIIVRKGQKVWLNEDIFGPDADLFNPERWLEDGHVARQATVGVYGNLLTFGGGHRACLGWRFAIYELSAFLVELLDQFQFEVDANVKIWSGAADSVMTPMVEGELDKGTQLPLRVRLASMAE
ncbi:cytochrome P450 [Schizophyllum commune H4-8]|nr:cytochrome P450 [Schizophyllum commune H4-8]KAI5899075.1 cytochrome P450 [Schizophyllum commune H4-8]